MLHAQPLHASIPRVTTALRFSLHLVVLVKNMRTHILVIKGPTDMFRHTHTRTYSHMYTHAHTCTDKLDNSATYSVTEL